MISPGKFPDTFEIYRGTDFKLYLELIDPSTKLPINYVGSTFSAILIDQQDSDFVVLATFSTTANTSITACTATIEFKLDKDVTSTLPNDLVYFRLYQEEYATAERFLYAIGKAEIKD